MPPNIAAEDVSRLAAETLALETDLSAGTRRDIYDIEDAIVTNVQRIIAVLHARGDESEAVDRLHDHLNALCSRWRNDADAGDREERLRVHEEIAGLLHALRGRYSNIAPERRERIDPHIRWMIRRDMPEVHEIENSSFEFPWFEEDFIRCLRQRNCIGMVAERDERVVGFMVYELHKTRLHLLTLAVQPEFRRRGVGEAMIGKLKGKLLHQRRRRILLEVREGNLPAQLFFRALGFRAISVLRDFYDDTTEDAYLMQYALPLEESSPYHLANRISRLAG